MSSLLPDFNVSKFTRFASARNESEVEVCLSSPNACKYDLVGALRDQYPNDDEFHANVIKLKKAVRALFPNYWSINVPRKVEGKMIYRDPPLWLLSDELTDDDLNKLLLFT